MKRPVSKSLLLGIALVIRLLLFTQASLAADTECSSDSGIPSGVIAAIDVGHLRKSLADAGFTIGGFYLGETFGNTGGTHQGETYDGVEKGPPSWLGPTSPVQARETPDRGSLGHPCERLAGASCFGSPSLQGVWALGTLMTRIYQAGSLFLLSQVSRSTILLPQIEGHSHEHLRHPPKSRGQRKKLSGNENPRTRRNPGSNPLGYSRAKRCSRNARFRSFRHSWASFPNPTRTVLSGLGCGDHIQPCVQARGQRA
jgi:hypothetical protein